MRDIPEAIVDEAADWADRLDDLSPPEREELAAWLRRSPDHARAFERMSRLLGDPALARALAAEARDGVVIAFPAGAAPPPFPAPPPLPARQPEMAISRPGSAAFMPSRRQALAAGIAGLAALPLAGYWLLDHGAPAAQPLRYASGIGRRRVVLPDGSGLLLDASSRVAVDFAPGRRAILLERGAARFDVLHDPARPFHVTSRNAKMVALGTSFSVDHLSDGSELRVFSGRVGLDAGRGEPMVVPANTWAWMDDTAQVATGTFDAAQSDDWQDDWLDARSMPLGAAIERLARHSGTPFRLADPRMAKRTFSGRFRLDTPEQSLALIGALFGMRPERRADGLYLTPPGGAPFPAGTLS